MSGLRAPAPKDAHYHDHRVAGIRSALKAYRSTLDLDDDNIACLLINLLADLRHFCDAYGLDFADLDRSAAMHHDIEVSD